MAQEVPLLELLLHLVWPVSCPLCGRIASTVCPSCLNRLVAPHPPICSDCGARFPCGFHDSFPIYSVTPYPGEGQRAIVAMKYHGMRAIAWKMGVAMGRTLPAPPPCWLVPIPLHTGSARDYNQSWWIAKGLGSVWKRRVRNALRWQSDLPRQATLTAMQRKNREGALFRVGAKIPDPMSVILVDDISTTGVTLRSAAQALSSAGVHVLAAAVWAQVLP